MVEVLANGSLYGLSNSRSSSSQCIIFNVNAIELNECKTRVEIVKEHIRSVYALQKDSCTFLHHISTGSVGCDLSFLLHKKMIHLGFYEEEKKT